MTRGPRDRFPTEEATGVHDFGSSRADTEVDICTLLPALDDRPGPARRLVASRNAAMVRAIMDAAQAPLPDALAPHGLGGAPVVAQKPPLGPLPAMPVMADGTRSALLRVPDSAPSRGRRGSRVVALMAAALVVTVVGGAAAAVWVARTTPPPIQVPAITVPAPEKKPARRPEPEITIIEEDISLDDELEQELEKELAELDMPAEVVSSPRRRPPAVDRELPEDATPEDVLALANQRRKEKRWRDADALYRRVMVHDKGTDAAVVAMVASAALHLERLDDAAGALRRYRRALRLQPSGPLAEESRWGVAESLRARGDTDAEAEALRAFMNSHPDSANARAAQSRLREIAPL